MKALVLGGGGLRIFWLAAKCRRLAINGYTVPDLIVGTSAGAIATTYLSTQLSDGLDFSQATFNLLTFLKKNIHHPSDVMKKRSIFDMAWDLYKGRWQGAYDLNPTYVKLGAEANRGRITDQVIVASLISHKTFPARAMPSMAIASSSEPILTKPVDNLVDGGLRDILPINWAIRAGATEITALACQRPEPDNLSLDPDRKLSFIEQVRGTIDTMTAEILDTDIRLTRAYTALVKAGKPMELDHKVVNLRVYRPYKAFNGDYSNFTQADLDNMIEDGLQNLQPEVDDE